VGATEVPELSIENNLHEGEGDNGPLKPKGFFERRPHLKEFFRFWSRRKGPRYMMRLERHSEELSKRRNKQR
jgi:hypothetical protein